MSRIIVKNLPSKASEDDIRKHFESKGRITDVRLMRKRDGSSRRFAFVGFKTDAEAEESVKFFNMSFMLSSRLDVSLAKALGDESLERRKENLKRKRLEQREESQAKEKSKQIKGETTNEKLEEFLSVMKPQKATAMWKNDSTDRSARPNSASDPTTASSKPKAGDDDDDEDAIVDIKELENQRKAAEGQNSDEEENMEVDKEEEEEEEEPDWVPQVTEDSEKTETAGPELSDMEWLRQRQTLIKENGEKPEHKPVEADEADAVNEEVPEPEEPEEPVVQATNRLFLRNLAFTVERNDLEELFKPFGVIKQIHIPIDPKNDKPKGLAFIEFEDIEEAQRALETLDGKSFQGRLMHIIYAQQQRSYQLDEFDIKNMPLKKQKALKMRMSAAKQQFSWNSLYMNKDTVLEATAAKLGLSKSQIMDPTSSNMAVQQALAESSVLESVQSYFKSKGVDLAKFHTKKDLSDNVILVKNLPFQTSAVELQDIFAQCGEVVRTLMPPDGGIAIVQFKLASAGRAAFKKLAFRRIGDSIMYLEKAPKGVLDETIPVESSSSVATTREKSAASSAKDLLLPENVDATVPDAETRTSVFVKNLNFATNVSALAKLFQAVPGYLNAVIKQKADPSNSERTLSMGFGFVEFRTYSQAEAAVKALQGTKLDGHDLQLKISTRGSDGDKKPSKAAASTKIVIKNIPFEATKKDITDLFGTFGVLRSVRVPRKFNRQTRGFAFAEFATPKEAEHAMSSLQGAHLLGRRLVMDYAEAEAEDAETEIARMEAKVAKQVSAVDAQGRRLGGQQKGFDMEDLDE